jgi:hypothetical protein
LTNSTVTFARETNLMAQGYGFLSEHQARSIPSEECTVDLIGPWKVQMHGKPHKYEAFVVPVMIPSHDPKTKTQAKISNQKHKS